MCLVGVFLLVFWNGCFFQSSCNLFTHLICMLIMTYADLSGCIMICIWISIHLLIFVCLIQCGFNYLYITMYVTSASHLFIGLFFLVHVCAGWSFWTLWPRRSAVQNHAAAHISLFITVFAQFFSSLLLIIWMPNNLHIFYKFSHLCVCHVHLQVHAFKVTWQVTGIVY